MRFLFVIVPALATVCACTIALPLGDLDTPGAPDARIDSGHDGGADAISFDTGPACVVGESRCGVDGREVCVLVGGPSWLRAPCDDYEVCVGGLCEVPVGRDLAPLASAPGWVHPDVGITRTAEAVGPEAFPQGLFLVNPFEQRVEGITWNHGGPVRSTLEPWSTTRVLTQWMTTLAQPSVGGSIAVARSAYEPGLYSQSWESSPLLVPLAIWMGSPASVTNILDVRCDTSSPPASCHARSFETTLVSGEMGTSFVVGALPTAAYYDACADELVVRGLPFLGVTNASGTNTVEVVSTARFGEGEPPTVPISDGEPPGPIEPGATERAVIYGTGSWQLVVAPPQTIEECAPAPSTECLRRCTARALDLSGTRITTTRESSVVIGHTCASATADGACGYALETVPPLTDLGVSYHVPGPASFESGEVLLHVVALADDTRVAAPDGTHALAAGATLTFGAPSDAVVTASAPVLVTRYSHRADEALAVAVARSDDGRAREHLVPAGTRAIVVLTPGDSLLLDGAEVGAPRRAFAGAALEVVEVVVSDDGAAHTLETTSPSHVLVAWVPSDPSLLAISRGARR